MARIRAIHPPLSAFPSTCHVSRDAALARRPASCPARLARLASVARNRFGATRDGPFRSILARTEKKKRTVLRALEKFQLVGQGVGRGLNCRQIRSSGPNR
jgi:hypothetical protein